MRIYIIEDDLSVISILEDIIEENNLGVICGDTDGEPPNLQQILALDPDLILIDLLMPGKDGVQVVRELRQAGCGAKFIMLSQVSDKEMVAKAYTAGVSFYISKPINLIEVRQVIANVARELANERALMAIQQVFAHREPAPVSQPDDPEERWRRRMKAILSQLGMAGEKGAQDIVEMCVLLLRERTTVSRTGMATLCAKLGDSPRTIEQRARRALEKGMRHIASLGLDDYNNETFVRYSARLFPFQEVRREMQFQQGGGTRGKASLKTFLDGLMILAEEE